MSRSERSQSIEFKNSDPDLLAHNLAIVKAEYERYGDAIATQIAERLLSRVDYPKSRRKPIVEIPENSKARAIVAFLQASPEQSFSAQEIAYGCGIVFDTTIYHLRNLLKLEKINRTEISGRSKKKYSGTVFYQFKEAL